MIGSHASVGIVLFLGTNHFTLFVLEDKEEEDLFTKLKQWWAQFPEKIMLWKNMHKTVCGERAAVYHGMSKGDEY